VRDSAVAVHAQWTDGGPDLNQSASQVRVERRIGPRVETQNEPFKDKVVAASDHRIIGQSAKTDYKVVL
jgi:hypothetical protein